MMPRAKPQNHILRRQLKLLDAQLLLNEAGHWTVRFGMLPFFNAPVSTEARGSTRSGTASRLMDVLVLHPTGVDFLMRLGTC